MNKLFPAGVLPLAIASALTAPIETWAQDRSAAHLSLAAEGEMPSLAGARGWLNAPPLTAASLRGRVVLVDFWTYSCINWRRTLPYLRAWADRYGPQGLVVIGVHTPEFPFEANADNVRRALNEMSIAYPVAIDSDYALWRAFDNHYWPALYFIDGQGHIRHHVFGEGDYEASERVIQRLLREAGAGGARADLVSVDARGVEAAADWASVQSPETYVGHERAERFASPGGALLDARHGYSFPARWRLNDWAFAGDWTVGKQSAVLASPHGRIGFRFHARDLHLVMGPAAGASSVRFRVRLDGQPPGAAHGVDVDAEGNGTMTQPRLYQMIRQSSPVLERQFEIEFLEAGAEAYSFTFG